MLLLDTHLKPVSETCFRRQELRNGQVSAELTGTGLANAQALSRPRPRSNIYIQVKVWIRGCYAGRKSVGGRGGGTWSYTTKSPDLSVFLVLFFLLVCDKLKIDKQKAKACVIKDNILLFDLCTLFDVYSEKSDQVTAIGWSRVIHLISGNAALLYITFSTCDEAVRLLRVYGVFSSHVSKSGSSTYQGFRVSLITVLLICQYVVPELRVCRVKTSVN